MAILIAGPTIVEAAGQPPKRIEEFVGRVNSRSADVSIAHMRSPAGWSEPGQTPEFDEYTIVLRGSLRVTLDDRQFDVEAGQAIIVHAGEWVQYSTPSPQGAEYVAVCLPAFAPDLVHRDTNTQPNPSLETAAKETAPQETTAIVLEPMAEHHGPAVIDIFNHYVTESFAAYPDRPLPQEFFERFRQMMQGYPALVARDDSGQVLGFGFLRPFHPASTLQRTAEISYFIARQFTRQGIGAALLERLVQEAIPRGIDCLIASISSRNPESIAFHRRNGFRECGRFSDAGRKKGLDFDIVWMQRRLG